MNTTLQYDGGLQTVIPLQVVYLDFDGETTSYHGEVQDIDEVIVADSGLSETEIATLIERLNEAYSGSVIFVTERPKSGDYSTVYVGSTEAFSYRGLAETVDFGNQNRNDNAFVNLHGDECLEQIQQTIAHEVDHLIGTLDHGGAGINRYTARYDISSGVTSTGIVLRSGTLYVYSGGVANNTTVIRSGIMRLLAGGIVNSTTVSAYGVMSLFGGEANHTIVKSDGSMYLDGGVANSTMVSSAGRLVIFSGGMANNTTVNFSGSMSVNGGKANNVAVNFGGYLYVYSGGTASIIFNPWGGTVASASGGTVIHLERDANCYYGNWTSGLLSRANSFEHLTVVDHAIIYSGGVANDTILNSGGRMTISSGGVANNTVVNFQSVLYLDNGGVGNNTIVSSGGGMDVLSGGTANSTTVSPGGRLYVSCGGSALNVNWTPCEGWVFVEDGAHVTYASNYSGCYWGYNDTLQGSALTVSSRVSYGYVYIFDSGSAENVTLDDIAYMYVFSGGTANRTTVNWSNAIHIANHGVANNTVVNTGAYMYISSGGVASNTTLYGSINISSGGTAIGVIVSQGVLHISNGGTVSCTTLTSGGRLFISSGGTITDTLLTSNGSMYISNGAMANNTLLISGGSLTLVGMANETTIARNGFLTIYNGGVTNNTMVNSGGYLYVSHGGTANNTELNFGGSLFISSGGSVNNIIITSGGSLFVSNGGVATNVIMNKGDLVVSANGTATIAFNPWHSGTVRSSAGAFVSYQERDANCYYGGAVSGLQSKADILENIVVNSGGSAIVYSLGRMNHAAVNTGGSMFLSSGGTASATTVKAGGALALDAGGTAHNTTVNSGGWVAGFRHLGSNAAFIEKMTGNVITGNASGLHISGVLNIGNNGKADQTTVVNGSMNIASGGNAINTTVNSKGSQSVSSGGSAGNTIVNAYGIVTIYAGGSAYHTTINSGGTFSLLHGGIATGLQLQAGAAFNVEIKGGASSCVAAGNNASGSFSISQGVASNLLIENGDRLTLGSGGSAIHTTVNSGGIVVNDGVMKQISAYGGALISGSGIFYLSQNDFIACGLLAQNRDIQYSSSLTFSGISGFTAAHDWHVAEKLQLKEAVVVRGGSLTLSSGASVTFLNNAGTVQVLNGANVRSVTNVSGAVCDVAGGLAAMFMNSAGAIEQVRNHGSALQTSNWGIQSVYSGGIANNTTVFKGGMQIVGSGGIAKSGSVSSGGLQNVSGGYASRTLIRPGGIQTVSAGGLVYSTTVSTGSQRIMNGGSAQETKVVRGSQYISSGGIAVDTQMSGVLLQHSKAITSDYQYSGDYVYWYESGGSRCMISSSWDASETETRYIYWYGYSGSQFVSAGGTASATQLSSGSIQTVFNGGTATETIVNASAFQYVLSGGIAKDVEVRSGGILTVEYDGYGENIDVDNGAIVGIHGVVKNLRMDKNASYYFDMGTAVFRGYLDCYLNPAELNTLMEILQYSSELEQLVLRITASDFGQDNYNLFSVDGFENLDYEFMLALPQNEYVVLNPGASYWYDGERYSIIYSSRDKQYSLNKTTAEAEHVLITSAGNIDLLETGTPLIWNKTSYQSYGIVHAVKETGNDQTVYLNRTISISGLLQEASALLFTTGKGTFQLGTNTFAVKVALKNSVEAKAYGVRGANRLLRRSGGSPALPANVTFDVNAAAVSGYALAAAFINESTSMTVTGQLNAPITVMATGRMAEAIGFYSGQTIAFSEMLDAAIKVQAEAEQQAWALGFSRLDATLMKLNLDVSGKSKTANANATGMVLSKSGDLQTGSIMKVNASAEKNAYAGGFVAAAVLSKEFAPGSIDTMAFTGTFLGNMTVTADGEKSLAVGIGSVDSPVSVSFAKGMTGSVVVSAKAQKAAEGYGLTGIASSAIGGTISVTAESATEQALAIGMTGQISTFSGNLQVSAIGVGFTEAYGFTDNPEKSSTGIDTISKTGKIMISASSGKKGTAPQGIVYAVGGEIYSAVAGILCATAQSANAQETYAIGAYASTITVSGTLAANARTRAIALCATSDTSSALNATVSGVLFAGYMSPETQSAAADNAALATKLAKISSNITTLTSYANAGNLGSAYSVYAYDQDDVVTLTSGAWLFGDVELGEGNNSLTISVGAKVFGSLYSTNGTLSLNYLLDTAASDSAVITSRNTSILGSGDARIRVTVSSATASGRYVLLQGNELSQKLTSGFRITLYDSASNKEVNLSAQESYSLRGVTYTLSQDGDAITLNVTGADPVKPGATGAVRGDFDGNGVSDILFQNLSDSANPLGAWMNADKTQWNGALGPAPKSDWTVYGAYDFTGSGVCDIMFRSKRADTQYAVGYYEDGDVSKFRTMGWGVTAEWELADVGDFNGSGRADILWKNSTNGYLGLWMDGTNQWVALPASNLGEGQSIIGMGDVNGDGCDDILINSNGVLGAWDISGVINGTETTPVWSSFGINIGSEWDAFGCADFDGNGKADIVLWRDDDGYVGTYMNCNVNDFRGIYPGASKDEWGLPGFGDYNGDGCDDVLVRNLASGALGYWDGAADFKWNEIGSGVDSTWAVIA